MSARCRNEALNRSAGKIVEHEQMRLQPLDRFGRPEQRNEDVSQDVADHAPQHAVSQWLELREEKRLGSQKSEAKGPIGQ